MRNPYARVDVERLLSRLGVKARRVGRQKWEGKCPSPDHPGGDRSPSWFIRDRPGEPFHACHKCLSCGFAGGPTVLASSVLGFGFEDAASVREWILGVESAPPPAGAPEIVVSKARRARTVLLPPGTRFDDWPSGASSYLARRGVTVEQVERWGLGFVGLRDQTNMAGRIVIPFRDAAGRVAHYTARAWGRAEKRYLEPGLDQNPDPSAIFGEVEWAEVETDVGVVVEGAFDALAASRCGAPAVAALAGSSPNAGQLNKLAVRFRRVVVLADPDPAGMRSALALRASLGCHLEVQVVDMMQFGRDPGALAEDAEGQAVLADLIGAMMARA